MPEQYNVLLSDTRAAQPLFTAESKSTPTSRCRTLAQLATDMQPLTVLLDDVWFNARASPDEPAPSWLFLYGTTDDDEGFGIHIYAASAGRWENIYKTGNAGAFEGDVQRMPIEMMFRIRQHNLLVSATLRDWKIARAASSLS